MDATSTPAAAAPTSADINDGVYFGGNAANEAPLFPEPLSFTSPMDATSTPAATAPTSADINDGVNFAGNAANEAPVRPESLSFKSPSTVSVEPQLRKRGRPRKYDTPEAAAAAAAARREAVPASAQRKGRRKSFHSGDGSSFHSGLTYLGGHGFTLHAINVSDGEDISHEIMLFLQQNKQELCILSASGTISSALLRRSASGVPINYQGDYEIVSLDGSFVQTDQGGKAGGFTACLSSSEGKLCGGLVDGPLIAKGSVKIIVATFLTIPPKRVNFGFKGDASASTMPSQAASTAACRPDVQSSGGFPMRGCDDHHNMEASSFMMQA